MTNHGNKLIDLHLDRLGKTQHDAVNASRSTLVFLHRYFRKEVEWAKIQKAKTIQTNTV